MLKTVEKEGKTWEKAGNFLLGFLEKKGGEKMEKRKEICLDNLEYIPCQKCWIPLIPVNWARQQAKKNLFETRYGISIHYFTCENCRTRWAIIILSDRESWGFIEAPAESAGRLYRWLLNMRKNGLSVENIRYAMFPQSYIS
ncbi:hypothetical protein J7K06_06695 [Candidatus Bathyarchaeota archaeon]|nr:hypothetical protein [Candidatus Bathyarchaeota archaeon]